MLIGLQAAQTMCPGAIISGFSTSAKFMRLSMMSGPLEENLLTIGACSPNVAILPSSIAAVPHYFMMTPFLPLQVCLW